MRITPEILLSVPLFADLDEIELVQVMACFSLQKLARGETLYTEGARATSACFIVNGELEAVTALPGGGEAVVGLIGIGDMIGEMALVAGGARTATVRALSDVTAITVSFAFFQAALNQMSVPAFKILRRIMVRLSMRLATLQNSIFKAWDCDGYRPVSFATDEEDLMADFRNGGKPAFDYWPFLPVTPFFEDFEEKEIERILNAAQVLEVPRDEYLYREGSKARSCFIVVRGAVDNSILRDRRYQLSVLGPGRLCGANALIKGDPHLCDARVRSEALLLEFDAENFGKLFGDSKIEALKFQAKISHNQLLDLRTADNLLTTVVSQAHVQASRTADISRQ